MNVQTFNSDDLFVSHSMNEDQLFRSNRINQKAKELAEAMIEGTFDGPLQSQAVMRLKESTMMAVLSIALEGKYSEGIHQ